MILSSRAVLLAACLLMAWMLAALGGLAFDWPFDRIVLERILAPPDRDAWFGHDDLGRSLAARLLVGAGPSFLVAATVVAISAVVGTTLGMFAGFAGGLVDRMVVSVINVFLAFPGILLAIALAAVLGAGLGSVVIALTAVGWVGFARLARAQTLSVRNLDHIAVAQALGTHPVQILRRHVLPLIAGPLLVEATFGLSSMIVAEAGLSFLGLGIQPPAPSWGAMIRDGTRYLLIAPHVVIIPGLALASVVVALNVLGDHLRDRLDPALARLA